jgi:chain length determinant protein (polysaccharide antigen chain regulator)
VLSAFVTLTKMMMLSKGKCLAMSDQQANSRSDEIDLFDLVDDIRDKWYWVVGVSILGALLAIVYAVTTTPLYRTEVVIKDAPGSDLVAFNQPALRTTLVLEARKDSLKDGGSTSDFALSAEPVFELTPETAFLGARAVIRSASTRKAFYQKLVRGEDEVLKALIFNELLTEEQNLALFLERFSFSDPGAKEKLDVFMTVSFELSDAQLATDVLNDYVAFALDKYDDQIQSELNRKLNAQLQLNGSWAESLRSAYDAEKERRIVELSEAAEIASAIGQQQPFYNSNDVVVSSEPPLYMMGEKALRAEIAQLRARDSLQSEDLFISGLPEILQNSAVLNSVTVDWDSVNYALVDQPALLPRKPVKPRKLLIVALGGTGGFMLGLLAALIAAGSARHVVRPR